jgi:hypothetical protein
LTGSSFVDGRKPVPSAAAPPITTPILEAEVAAEPATEMAAIAEDEELIKEELPVIDAAERDRLAAEMRRWNTRDPRSLVEVIADLAEERPLPLPPTFLLSIAWSETRGKILAVSPAGAAGLAQATPAAYLSEGFDGKVFVTNSYLMGTRAYIMKKPLGDAMSISASLLRKNTPATRARARELTARAMELRREGMNELEALRPVANATFFERIDEGDAHNLATLKALDKLIAAGAPRAKTKAFHARVQRDYQYLRNLQRQGWAKYERQLTTKRDALLRAKFGTNASRVIRERPYEAGEYLGRVLDARFSPTQMAEFLAEHLDTKKEQARELGIAEDKLPAWTAALYNGGAVNIRRMQAGLIRSLTETEKYMKAVPARSALLARILS